MKIQIEINRSLSANSCNKNIYITLFFLIRGLDQSNLSDKFDLEK